MTKLRRANDEDKYDGCKSADNSPLRGLIVIFLAFAAVAGNQARGGAINRSKTMMDNLRRNDTKKVKRNEGGLNASQVRLEDLSQLFQLIVSLFRLSNRPSSKSRLWSSTKRLLLAISCIPRIQLSHSQTIWTWSSTSRDKLQIRLQICPQLL
jgi:hypothetical protein